MCCFWPWEPCWIFSHHCHHGAAGPAGGGGRGIHPVHLGIVFLANMQIGYFTPPVGMNLFIASYRFNKPLLELYAAAWPFWWCC